MSTAKLSTIIVALLLVFVPDAAAGTGLSVAISAPRSGQKLSGAVTWKGKVGGGTKRVVFAIDGKAVWSQRKSPFLYRGARNSLDTKALPDGQHVLSATAYGASGAKKTSRITVIVANPAASASKPSTPRPSAAKPTTAAPSEPIAAGPSTEPLGGSQPLPPPTGGEVPLPEVAPADRRSLYWGASIGSQFTGTQAPWDMSAVTRFEESAQKPVSLIQFFQPFETCATAPCRFYGFPKTELERIRAHGSIPILSWASESTPASLNEPDFQLADLIEGDYDSQIRAFAAAAKQWGHPFFLRFDWEMNGGWFPWSESANGNHPGEYVTAWRHVHDIFTAVGATNANWVWCANIDPAHALPSIAPLYPGDEYVDWTSLDGYNWGSNPIKPGGWRTFDQIYSTTYREVTETIAPSKPMLIGEIASTEYGGSKAAWIADALERIPAAYPKIHGLVWFDKLDGGFDWPIETSSNATAAFASGLRSPLYLPNSFSSIAGPKIGPFN